MRRFTIGFIILTLFAWAHGQDSKFGGSLSYGQGGLVNMGQVQTYLDQERSKDPAVQVFELRNTSGRVLCAEGVAAYYFSRRFSIHSGVLYQNQRNDVVIDYYRTPNGGASYDSVTSTATFALQSLSVPLTAKYAFRKRAALSPYVTAGTGYEWRFRARMRSLETFSYRNGIYEGTVANSFADRRIVGLTVGGLRYSLGAGVDLNLEGWRDGVLSLGFVWQGNLPGGEVWVQGTSDGYLGAVHNRVYERAFQEGVSGRFDDWRNGYWAIRIGLVL